MQQFVSEHPDTPGGLVGCDMLPDLVAALKKPRKIILLVKAGPAVDAIVEQLLEAGVERADIVVDCGNSQWTDTIRRETQYAEPLPFFGSGVCGGEVGARFGPSLMPGGNPDCLEAPRADLAGHRRQGRPEDRQTAGGLRARQAGRGRRAVHRVHRPERRRPLREDGPQRHRVHRHAAHLARRTTSCAALRGLETAELAESLRRVERGRARLLPDPDHRRHPRPARPGQPEEVPRSTPSSTPPARRAPASGRDQRPRPRHPRQRHRRGGVRAVPLRPEGTSASPPRGAQGAARQRIAAARRA